MPDLPSLLGSVRDAFHRVRGVAATRKRGAEELEPDDLLTPIDGLGDHTEVEHPVPGPLIGRVVSRDVRRLTGELGSGRSSTVTMGNVAGTDLGHMFQSETTGALHVVFGDSFGRGAKLPPEPGRKPEELPDWRSNAMAVVADPSRLVSSGLDSARMITDSPGHAKELIPGWHQSNDAGGEVTKIATNGIAVGSRLLLHYMSVKRWAEPGEWEINYSSVAYSDNQGQDWRVSPPMWPGDTNFAQVAFVREQSHLYLFGIPHGRFGGVKLARVRADSQSPLDAHAYAYLREAGRDDWVADEVDAAEIIRGPIGELSVMWNDFLGRWIVMYVRPPSEGSQEAIMVREASSLTGQWSEPKEVCPGGYGSYVHPLLVENRGETVYFTRSRWFSESDAQHYNVWLMAAHFTKAH